MNKPQLPLNSNLAKLIFVANKLGPLLNDVVFLGGSTIELFVTDPEYSDIRFTMDVDCLVDVITLNEYHKIEKQLWDLGFVHSPDDDVICRWRYEDAILDVVPTNEKILGFGNIWNKAAVNCSMLYSINEDTSIRVITPPYILATKFEAFKQRGNNNYFASHDFEDIVTLLDAREELTKEISSSEDDVRLYITEQFHKIIRDPSFHAALPGHLNYGPATNERVGIVTGRIEKIIANTR